MASGRAVSAPAATSSRNPAGDFSRGSSFCARGQPPVAAKHRRRGALLNTCKCGTALALFYLLNAAFFGVLVLAATSISSRGTAMPRPNTQYPPVVRKSQPVDGADNANLLSRTVLRWTESWRDNELNGALEKAGHM